MAQRMTGRVILTVTHRNGDVEMVTLYEHSLHYFVNTSRMVSSHIEKIECVWEVFDEVCVSQGMDW